MIKVTILLGRLSPERNPIPFELAEGLSKRGFKVEVLAGYPSKGISKEKIAKYRLQPEEVVNDNLLIRRVGVYREDKGSLFRRGLDYLRLSFDVYNAAKTSGANVFLVYSSPPFLILSVNRLKKFGAVVLNIQDLFPNSLLALLSPTFKLFFQALLRRVMKGSYCGATRIVTISEDMKFSISEYGVDFRKIKVAYNWADVSNVYYVPPEENPLFEDFKLDRSEKYIVYAGNIGKFQAVEKIIELAEVSQDLGRKYQFVIVGGGSGLKLIELLIAQRKLKNVRLFPLQPPEKVKYVYSLGFLNVLSLAPGVIKYAHPSKTAYLLATGVPILGLMEDTSSLSEFIIRNDLGVVISNTSDKQSMIDGLERIEAKQYVVYEKEPNNSSIKRYCFQEALDVYTETIYESVEAEEDKYV